MFDSWYVKEALVSLAMLAIFAAVVIVALETCLT